MTNPSKVEKIQTHFQALSSAATSLNTASDELTKVVGVLDEALRKLNVGLPVWVTVSRWEDELRRGQDEIGYCKVNGKWGIALCRSWNDDAGGEDTIEGLWHFNDAPREVRLAGVDKLPEVIEALSKEAIETTKKVQEKTKEVRELASVIEKITHQPSRTERSKNANKVVTVGLSSEQLAAILAAVQQQQKFLGELAAREELVAHVAAHRVGFAGEQRLIEALRQHHQASSQALLATLLEGVRQFSLTVLELEGVALNILLFMRLCRGEIRSIFGSSRRKKPK